MRTWFAGPGGAPSHSVRIGTRSTDSTSLVTTVTLGSAGAFEVGGEIAVDFDGQQPAGLRGQGRGDRAAAGPDLENRIVRRRRDAPSTSLLTHAASRKCCANRLRALIAAGFVESLACRQ